MSDIVITKGSDLYVNTCYFLWSTILLLNNILTSVKSHSKNSQHNVHNLYFCLLTYKEYVSENFN